jgi:hypothetical protein
MSESNMRQRLVKELRPLHAIAVENPAGIGTPDINFVLGWIECKWLRNWPKRHDTIVKLQHDLTLEQRVWAKERISKGGNAWVILQCKRDWLIFRGDKAAKLIGNATRVQLLHNADAVLNGLKQTELIEALNATKL